MKHLFIILGLLTLVSCESGDTKKWVEECANDQIAGHTCEEPPVEPPVIEDENFELSELKSFNPYPGSSTSLILKFDKITDEYHNYPNARIFKSSTNKYKQNNIWISEVHKAFIFENGTLVYEVGILVTGLNWVFTPHNKVWGIDNNEFFIDGQLTYNLTFFE